MTTHQLCSSCEARHKKDTTPIVSGGVTSFPMPGQSKCKECQATADGFESCLACAIEKARCQGCGFWFIGKKPSPKLLAEVTSHRETWNKTREAAKAKYEQTIAPFLAEATAYEQSVAESERQFHQECEELHTKESTARAAYDAAEHGTEEYEKAQRTWSEIYFKGREEGVEAYRRHDARAREHRTHFAHYRQYYVAGRTRDGEVRRANGMFHAEIERCFAIADIDAQRERSLAEVAARFKRSVEFQNSLDRLDTAVASISDPKENES